MRKVIGSKAYDLYNENFDSYVQLILNEASEAQRSLMPVDIAQKAFRAGKFKVNKLTFGEKMYLLTMVLGRDAIVFVAGGNDDENVVNTKALNDTWKALKKRKPIVDVAEVIHENVMFAIGAKDLMETVSFIRMVGASRIWKTVIPASKRERKLYGKYQEHRAAYKELVNMFLQYEVNKRRMKVEFGFSLAEWYALIHYFQYGEGNARSYLDRFKAAQGARETVMRQGMQRLVNQGYLHRRGRSKIVTYSLSAKGDAAIMDMFEKVILK